MMSGNEHLYNPTVIEFICCNAEHNGAKKKKVHVPWPEHNGAKKKKVHVPWPNDHVFVGPSHADQRNLCSAHYGAVCAHVWFFQNSRAKEVSFS